VTGLTFISPDLAGKRMQLLREVLPAARRVALLWASYGGNLVAREIALITETANSLRIVVEPQSIDSGEALVRWFDRAASHRPDAIQVVADLKMVSYRDILVDRSRRLKLPLFAGWADVVRSGALLSYSAVFTELFRRSAHYVDRILRGAKPGDLPVEQPTRFELVVNAGAARALGIQIPRQILVRADEVIG
jgi:putative ABC transport system substrate-binding protein